MWRAATSDVRGRGLSLHVGVNSPFPGWIKDGLRPLRGCDAAAREMARLAAERGVSTTTRVTRDETRVADVEAWLAGAAEEARAGDLVVFTFAGHGIVVPDVIGASPEGEALVCSDGVLVDDRLHDLLSAFAGGVRIAIVAEACHSGSLIGAATMPADVLLIAAADRTSRAPGAAAGEALPPFTQRLVDAWDRSSGHFDGGYEEWAVSSEAVFNAGLVTNAAFARQDPFSI